MLVYFFGKKNSNGPAYSIWDRYNQIENVLRIGGSYDLGIVVISFSVCP
jgi:hypothetical protein